SVGYYSKHIQERLYRVKMMEGESLSIIHEAISMIRVIVAFGREGHEYRRFREQSETAVEARVRLTVRQTLFTMVVDTITAIGIGKTTGHIAFENVGFSYAERVDTLKDISFEAKPGQVIGLVGPTGAGKTTLISLLPRFYDSIAGRILLDGRDIKTLKLRSLR